MECINTIKESFKGKNIQHRVYIIVYIVSSFLSLIGFVLGILFGASFWMNFPHLLTIFMCTIVPMLGRKNMYKTFSFVVSYVSILYLPFVLFTNGGASGAGSIYLVMIIVFYAFHFKGKTLVLSVVLLNLYYASILVFAHFNPSFTIPYPDEISHVIDLCVAIVSVSTVLVVISYGSFSGYKKESQNVFQLMEEINGKNQFLEKLTITDQLTGLYARSYIEDKITEEIQKAEKDNASFCLLMIDIDFFKKVNDTYGHLFGDEVIRLVSKALMNNVQRMDCVARFGGEEFMLLLPEKSGENGRQVAEHIRQHIEDLRIRNRIRVTVSAGVSTYQKGDTKEMLIERADQALYEAKESGRNKVCEA